MSPIYFWRYTLRSVTGLNALRTRTEHEGALIRVGDGFGCIHPWPELGDLPLSEQLERLLRGEAFYTPLIHGAMGCAKWDGEARKTGLSLFSASVPESHWLAREGDDPGFARSEGFSTAKIKGSRDLERVRNLVRDWSQAGLHVRLDFNESLMKGTFLPWWQSLTDHEREMIEVVEDPEMWTEEGWMALRDAGVPLAVDRDHTSRLRLGDVMVYKPAHFGWTGNHETEFYITSYMDHALGQIYAAAVAAEASRNGENKMLLTCGLLTHRCFEPDPFFEQLHCDGPRLIPPGGTGLGFDDLLEGLPWKRLS